MKAEIEIYTVLYTGVCWKHHISEHFENNDYIIIGACSGGTVFTDYPKMIEYLKKDGISWHVAELQLKNEILIFEFGNNYMATIPFCRISEKGFRPCVITY